MSEFIATHPVIDELTRRINGEPGQLRLALCIEGGGMRSVITAGMTSSLIDHCILPEHFDAVFGTSGGAFNAAYFLAKQSDAGASGYWENAGRDLIDFRRLVKRGRPVIDMEHMIYGLQHNKPLDFDTVISSQKLRPLAADMTSRRTVAFEPACTKEELLQQLRATSAVPVLGHGRVSMNDTEYLDGGKFERVPFKTPLKLGYNGLLILLSKELVANAPLATELSRYKRIKRTLGRLHPDFFDLALENPQRKHETIQEIQDMALNLDTPPFVYVICPLEDAPKVGRFDLDPEIVKAGAAAGQLAVDQVFRLQVQ